MEQTFKDIRNLLAQRILILDGAMGTKIQQFGLSAEHFHGKRFASHPVSLAGNNDILCLTAPDVVKDIHRLYIEAGADIIATNTFSSNQISQQEYGCADIAAEMAREGARLARQVADAFGGQRTTDNGQWTTVNGQWSMVNERRIFVAGSMGPTAKSLSLASDMSKPAHRSISFDEMAEAYREQAEALLEGGADFLLLETCYDALNTKAALYAISDINRRFHRQIPVMVSVTVNDRSGRTLTGQTLWAFYTSVCHYPYLLSFGLNCSFGVTDLRPFVEQLSANVPLPISIYPNAGLPNQMGEYDEHPGFTAQHLREMAEAGLINIAGGCCGTNEQHIRAIADALHNIEPRTVPAKDDRLRVSGLEPLLIDRKTQNFTNVGERTNVAGSRRFARLIAEKQYDEALAVARQQIEGGATVIDINMDDAMLDSQQEMQTFCRHISGEPAVGKAVLMIDSSDWPTILAGLKNAQGKCIVNSISLKAGEQDFLQKALELRRLGAAVVVMAFDEEGQATTFLDKTNIAQRAYHLLTSIGFPPQDIIFDANILSVGTGIKEHQTYAVDFIRAVRWIKENLPHAKTSGGLSNLSFAFRGNNKVREAMHSVFLYHAIRAGLNMAIVNPSTKVMYEDISAPLLEALEDVILCRREDATDRLIAMAEQFKADTDQAKPTVDRHTIALEERLTMALQHGDDEFLLPDLEEALVVYPSPAAIIEGPLMQGMTFVGRLFGEGKMFLPQVVKTARTMKRAVEILQPHIEAQSAGKVGKSGRYLLATVKGDVHDIGKNIAAVVLACNNFEVIDLGVMIPAEQIVQAAIENKVDYIGLSGLITPSLDEMCRVARELKAAGVSVPLFIGGATTSALHTALKIAPLYDGPVFYVKDAAQNPIIAMQLAGSEREQVIASLREEQQLLRASAETPRQVACEPSRLQIDWSQERIVEPSYRGVRSYEIALTDVIPYINWTHFYNLWRVERGSAEAEKIRLEAEQMLGRMSHHLRARVGFFAARATDDAIVLTHAEGCKCCGGTERETTIATPRQSQPNTDGVALSLCDFVAAEGDFVGAFAVTVSDSFVKELEAMKSGGDEYDALLMQSVGDRLVEAASEWLHERVRKELWGYAPEENISVKEMYQAAYQGIRPAVGYPSLPDQKAIFPLNEVLAMEEIGITLTENGAMYPQASVCGLYIASRHAKYFVIK